MQLKYLIFFFNFVYDNFICLRLQLLPHISQFHFGEIHAGVKQLQDHVLFLSGAHFKANFPS